MGRIGGLQELKAAKCYNASIAHGEFNRHPEVHRFIKPLFGDAVRIDYRKVEAAVELFPGLWVSPRRPTGWLRKGACHCVHPLGFVCQNT